MRPTDEEIRKEINKTLPAKERERGGHLYDEFGMTYEEGVDAALRWVLGETDDKPMES